MFKGTHRGKILLLTTLAACHQEAVAPASLSVPVESSTFASAADGPASAEEDSLARYLSIVLQDPASRQIVLRAMQASPYTKHRVVVLDLLRSAAGSPLVHALSRARGISPPEVVARVERLPMLALAVTSRQQRESWRGENTPAVAVAGSERGSPRTFVSGVPRSSALEHTASGGVLIALLRVDHLVERLGGVQAARGLTIQPVGEEDAGGFFVRRLPNGDSVVVQLAALGADSGPSGQVGAQLIIEPCEETGSCGGGGTGAPAPTKLGLLFTVDAEDFGSRTDGLELRFDTRWVLTSTGQTVETMNSGLDIGNNNQINANLPLIFRQMDATHVVVLDVWENDGWWGDDHYVGPLYINSTDLNHNVAPRFLEPRFSGGANRCAWSAPTGYYDCPHTYSWGGFFFREINFNVRW